MRYPVIPNKWVVIKTEYKDETFYKVLGGWKGGYLDSDSWRLNSGIKEIIDGGDHWDFEGFSGSLYRGFKSNYGMTMLSAGVWNEMKEKFGDKVELMPEDTDWLNLLGDANEA